MHVKPFRESIIHVEHIVDFKTSENLFDINGFAKPISEFADTLFCAITERWPM